MSERSEGARRPVQPSALRKRFYGDVTVAAEDAGWGIRLDGRQLCTPAGAALTLPARPLAEAVAEEWERQGERIDPAAMPLTRLVNAAIDRVQGREEAVVGEIAAYSASDLLCYRAPGPEALVAMQRAHWDAVLGWVESEFGARFEPAEGVVHRAQPEGALAAVRREIARFDAFGLAALHAITTLTGSALLALAHARGRLGTEEVWRAAHVDEDWQISQWGEDAEAAARRAARRREMEAASRLIALRDE